jgi:ribosomal-protein-alanine N-acetyltransferase
VFEDHGRRLQLQTRRLTLIACPTEFIDALARGADEAGLLLGLRLPDGWPDPELASFLPIYAGQLREDPSMLGYGVWLIVAKDTQTVIGSAGFQGKPDDAGLIEVGYGVHPDFRNAGYATEAVEALLEWAQEQQDVRGVLAHCDADNTPSIRVVQKAGLKATGTKEAQLEWATEWPDQSA